MTEQWINANFNVEPGPFGDAIDWGNGVHTPVSAFITMFGDVIQTALTAGTDPKQAIIASDPENIKGFNDLLQ